MRTDSSYFQQCSPDISRCNGEEALSAYQSTLAPEAFTTGAQFATSERMKLRELHSRFRYAYI